MNRLTESDIIAPFIGMDVNPERFNSVVHRSYGNDYTIRNVDYIDSPQYCELFGVTDRLKEMWGYSGVDFTLHLTLENWTITKCNLDKLSECGGHGRPITHVLSISQQELRVARRILQYITN